MRNAGVEMIVGTAAVLAAVPRLATAADAWGQGSEAADLPFFLTRPGRLRTIPTLLLLREPTGDLAGAVLAVEYRGLLRGLYTSTNRRGRRTVFAPVEDRVETAAIAARALLERGARFVNLDIDLGPRPEIPDDAAWARRQALAGLRLRDAPAEWALHRGIKRFDVPLAGDYDATLALLGKRTRRNLRHYERLCRQELQCSFVPQATITWDELRAMNAECSFRADDRALRWRFDMLSQRPNTFLAGLKDGRGRWLSLLGGRRGGGLTEIDWQMNRRGLERYSISTVMRSFLIAEEVRRGSTSLSAEGGTIHSMASSFRFRSVDNLAVRRPSLLLAGLSWALTRRYPGMTLTEALHKPWRQWRPC